jgi:ribosomal protein S18 acetylase RimI-like enzyme
VGADGGGSAGAARAPLIEDADDAGLVRSLFREYVDSLGVDLSFQEPEAELAALPGGYDVLLVARVDGEPVGCVGVRPQEGDACELKRLYVRPAGRGLGLGRRLTLEAIARARGLGYARMRLDTLPGMDAAQELYRTLGFVEIEPYRHNPIAGSRFLELDLRP